MQKEGGEKAFDKRNVFAIKAFRAHSTGEEGKKKGKKWLPQMCLKAESIY